MRPHHALPLLLLAFAQGCGAPHSAARPSAPGGMRGGGSRADSVQLAAKSADTYGGDSDGSEVDEKAPAPEAPPAPAPPPPPSPRATPDAPMSPAEGKPQPPAQTTPTPGKAPVSDAGKRAAILLYTGDFSLGVPEVSAGLRELETMTREVGGFVSKRTDRMIIIRVPAQRFYEVVGRIEHLGEVLRRDVTAQDVTEEFLDTELRLRNARAVRARLQELLARATTVQDSLMIERELDRISVEIDRMEGRLKYLRDRAAFSTITVSLEPRNAAPHPPTVRLPFPWLGSGGLNRLLSL